MSRLIDADALMEKLEAWKKEAERINANINYTFASAIMAQVNAEPTIEKRKTGKWIPWSEDENFAICSNCGICEDTFEYVKHWHFCPNCGADMRGGNHETP